MEHESTPATITLYLKEFSSGTLKATLSNIPVLGSYINEALFDMRGRIKQERVNKLIFLVKEKLEKIDEYYLNKDILLTEEFSDTIEKILIESSKTRSQEKLQILANIWINTTQFKHINSFEKSDLFIDILSDLNESEIILLKNLKITFENSSYGRSLEKLPQTKKFQYETISFNIDYKKTIVFGLDSDTFRICFESLIAKSLVYDDGLGGIGGGQLRSKIGFTHLGQKLIEYLTEISI